VKPQPIYSGMSTLYEENTTGTACYIYGPQGQLAKRTTINEESRMFYYHTDHLGSTRLVTNESKNIVSATTYHPYGEPNAEEGTEEYLFTGKEQDVTGFYYYGARYYDPEIGRFLTGDPLKGERREPQTLNRYAYCLNNPLKYIDPTGMEEESKSAQQKVEEVFESLQDVDPDDLAEVQDLIDAGNYIEALEMMMELLDYDCWLNDDGSLTVIIDDEEWTMIIDNELKDEKSGEPAHGTTNHDNNTIKLNFSSGKVGDVILSALHEVCHAILGGTTFEAVDKEHEFIFGVEFNYMIALNGQGVHPSNSYLHHCSASHYCLENIHM
jgi:RHS repeat-associated protein